MADFSTLDPIAAADAGAVFIPKHPATGKPLDSEFDVIGADSGRVKKILNKGKLNAVVHLMETKKKRGEKEPTPEEIAQSMELGDAQKEALELDIVCECVTGWRNVMLDGKPVALEDRRTFFARYRWLVEQIIAFMDDRANFMQTAETN